jgi:hypothetical protein
MESALTKVPLERRKVVRGRGVEALPAPHGRPSRVQEPNATRVPPGSQEEHRGDLRRGPGVLTLGGAGKGAHGEDGGHTGGKGRLQVPAACGQSLRLETFASA